MKSGTIPKISSTADLTVVNKAGKEKMPEPKMDAQMLPIQYEKCFIDNEQFKVIYINNSKKLVTFIPIKHCHILEVDEQFQIGLRDYKVTVSNSKRRKFTALLL